MLNLLLAVKSFFEKFIMKWKNENRRKETESER